MLTLYGTPKSRAFRPLWLLEELEIDFAHRDLPPHHPDITALNPSGRVPVLVSNGVTITDSTAILVHLADRERRLTAPPGSQDRARQDSIMLQALDELEGPLWTAARHSFILPKERRMPEIKDSLRWEFAIALDRMAKRVGDRPFAAGPHFTIADIVLGHICDWAEVAKFPFDNAALRDYRDRMRARPAYARAARV